MTEDTAAGASPEVVAEIEGMLDLIRVLALSSANGSFSSEDRYSNAEQYATLVTELSRTAQIGYPDGAPALIPTDGTVAPARLEVLDAEGNTVATYTGGATAARTTGAEGSAPWLALMLFTSEELTPEPEELHRYIPAHLDDDAAQSAPGPGPEADAARLAILTAIQNELQAGATHPEALEQLSRAYRTCSPRVHMEPSFWAYLPGERSLLLTAIAGETGSLPAGESAPAIAQLARAYSLLTSSALPVATEGGSAVLSVRSVSGGAGGFKVGLCLELEP